jgi:predicted Rdx family selenoprotein
MPKFVIERELPGAGKLSSQDLHEISVKSNKVISDLGPDIHWLHSYVTDDKLFCVYIAPDEDIIFEHARCGGFPADKVLKVSTVIDPSTGE